MKIPSFTMRRSVHFVLIFIPLTVLFMLAFFAQIGTAVCRTCEKFLSKIAVSIMLNFERGE